MSTKGASRSALLFPGLTYTEAVARVLADGATRYKLRDRILEDRGFACCLPVVVASTTDPNQGLIDMESSHDSANRRVVLRAIETTFHRWRLGARPRANYAALCGLVVAVVVPLAGETLLARVGVEFSPGNLGWLGIALVAGTVVYQLALRWSDPPLTFTEMLDRQLSEYKPLNREAYRLLQRMTRDAGALDVDLVAEWLQSERDALVSASARRSPAPTFLERQI